MRSDLKSATMLAPAWRSLLFVPAINDRHIQKAKTTLADAIVIDLEDSVPLKDKEAARAGVTKIASEIRRSGRDVLVRINRPLPLAVRDLEQCVGPDVVGVVVAKTESAEHLRFIAELLHEREAALSLPLRHTCIVGLIENAAALLRLEEISRADRVVALACGDEDLAADIGCSAQSETIGSFKHRLVLAAAAGGLHPIGLMGTITDFRDLETFQALALRSHQAGLRGTFCIHPAQVEMANEAFSVSPEEEAMAARVVEAATAANASGNAVVALDGRMVDAPIVKRAHALLARSANYARKQPGL